MSKSKFTKTVRLAIIGTGGMANGHAENYKKIPGVELVAAMDVDPKRAAGFAEKHGIDKTFTKLEDLLDWDQFDAVSNVTPDGFHAPLSIASLKAGKHVLCEKPLALNHADTQKMLSAARKSGRIHMVNFSYRNWPCIHGVVSEILKGTIGEIRHVEASYLQSWLSSKIWGDWHTTPAWLWRLSQKHGSKGVLGDVGVHILDFTTFPVGEVSKVYCRLKTFPKAPGNRVGEYKLDANDSALMTVEFKNGAIGVIHTTRFATGHANRLYLQIYGTKGGIEIDSERSTEVYRVCKGKDIDKAAWKEVKAPAVPSNYERFITSIRTGKNLQPDFARGSEIQKILDSCFKSNALGKAIAV
jgi:predicted dehydrogenase